MAKKKKQLKDYPLKDLRKGARMTFLEVCDDLGHILIGAKHLDEEDIIELIEKGLTYLKIVSNEVVDRLMKECGLKK